MKELEYTEQAIPKGRRFCTYCGKVKRESSFDGDSTHCKDCCHAMLHTQVRRSGVLVAVLTVVVLAVVGWLGAQTIPDVIAIHKADALAKEHRLYDAVEAYDEAFGNIDAKNEKISPDKKLLTPGLRTWEKYFTVYADAYSEYDAAAKMGNTLNWRTASTSNKLGKLQETRRIYEAVLGKVRSISEKYDFENKKDIPYDEVLKELDAVRVDGEERYVKGYVEFFKSGLVRFIDEDKQDVALAHLEKALEYIPEEYVMFGTEIASQALEQKDYEKSAKMASAILEKNANYGEAYGWLAESYYAQGKKDEAKATLDKMQSVTPDLPSYYEYRVKYAILDGDYREAEELCNKQDEANSAVVEAAFNELLSKRELPAKAEKIFLQSIDYSLTEAVLMLLEGDADSAFNIAYNYAFNYAYYYDYITGGQSMNQRIINVTTLCVEMFKGDNAKEAEDLVAATGPCDEETKKIINGEITLEEAIREGKVNLL